MIFKLAVRNLFRNRWRSLLTAGGVATAVAMLVWTTALNDGMMATMIRGATEVELGQVQVHAQSYVERSTIFHSFPAGADELDAIRSVPGVVGATGRVLAYGLVGHERRSQVARLVGVSPSGEAGVTLLPDSIVEGRWLSDDPADYPAPREIVLGVQFARQLGISVGDELVMFMQAADGSLGNDLLVVVGIAETGNSQIDRLTAYFELSDLQYIGALEGRFHEIAIKVDDYQAAPQVADRVESALAALDPPEPLSVQPWQEINPEMGTMLELYDRSNGITFFIIFAIVALGIVNTQRMSALERRREFGVLMAIGLRPGQLGRIIVVETIVLTLAGALLGSALGLGISLHHASAGFDMSAFSDQASFSMMGIAFSERLYFVVEPEAVTSPIIWTVVVALLCSLWPALKSARLNVTQAISGR